MYSGTTFRTKSGRVMGVHQRIDRVARQRITSRLPKNVAFPSAHDILHFEGKNGPDGIKRKSPGKDEPWHYIDPLHEGEHDFLEMINNHIHNLAQALREANQERAAFEAAWLAHGVTDGLTPAHHYPLEEKLQELRGGQGLETRITKKDKIILPGKTRRHQIKNNWEFWGVKGVMTTHLAFELGIATTIASRRFNGVGPTDEEYTRVEREGFEPIYREILREIGDMGMYEEFSRLGWTRHLARETRDELIPLIIKAVMLSWWQAIHEAKEQRS